MNADRLLALYEQVAEAPNAVPRLRRFVLDLAVRGKLVAQGRARRTGVGVAEADRCGEGTASEGRRDQEEGGAGPEDGRAAPRDSGKLALGLSGDRFSNTTQGRSANRSRSNPHFGCLNWRI